jgi:hypothetical protein
MIIIMIIIISILYRTFPQMNILDSL